MASSTQHSSGPEKIDIFGIVNHFAKAFFRLWPLVIVLALLFSGTTYFRERRSFRPVYKCTAILSVGSDAASGNDIFTSYHYYDSTTAKQIASTFPHLLSTEFMRDLIAENLESGFINGSISASAYENTDLVEISVTSSNPQSAYDVLQAVLIAYPKAAVYMVDNPVLYVREAPAVPTAPINSFSPSGAVRRGAVKGAALGAAIIALFALVTVTVSSAEDLRKLVNLPILATFPLIRQKKRSRKELLTAESDPGLAEALRGLRAKIRKQLQQQEGKVILMTSTIPGEGKTTVSVNLALSLVEEGHRVILVDADLRNQTVARLFGNEQESAGLMELLKNPNQPLKDFLKRDPVTGLCYISGSSTQQRHYSLDSKALRQVLTKLKTGFDYVVVDTPPCSVVSDTAMLCRHADAVAYVVKMDYANRFRILDGVTMLHQKDVPLIGCVVNGAASQPSRYGYGYGYGYGKKYGYGDKKFK